MPELAERSQRSINDLPAPRARRALVIISRGPMDKPSRVVFRYEIPILEALHGEGNVVEVQEHDPDGRSLVRRALSAKGPVISTEVETDDGELEVRLAHYDPTTNPREEYNRLVNVYGMHPEQPVSMVEYVFGRYSEGRFEAAVMGSAVKGERVRKVQSEDLMSLKGPEIDARLADMGVEYDPSATVKTKRELLRHELESKGLLE